jgi:hypothetical protein
VARPVGRSDLLSDQPVAGFLVGRAQQGFGQAHQRQALAGVEAELLQEALHHALALGAGAGLADEVGGFSQHRGAQLGRQWSVLEECADGLALVDELGGVERVPVHAGHISDADRDASGMFMARRAFRACGSCPQAPESAQSKGPGVSAGPSP